MHVVVYSPRDIVRAPPFESTLEGSLRRLAVDSMRATLARCLDVKDSFGYGMLLQAYVYCPVDSQPWMQDQPSQFLRVPGFVIRISTAVCRCFEHSVAEFGRRFVEKDVWKPRTKLEGFTNTARFISSYIRRRTTSKKQCVGYHVGVGKQQ